MITSPHTACLTHEFHKKITHDHKPTHGLPHTWQIKHSHCQNGFTQNPQPIHKSINPRPHWSWLHTKHLATTTTHHPRPKITTHRQNPIRNPNIGSHKIHDLYPHGFTQKSYPYHHGSHHSKLTIQSWVRERNREMKNREEEGREQPRGRETKATKESHCRVWWKHWRCMVPVKEQGSWPWWPWFDPSEKAMRESEKKERRWEKG